MRGVTIQVRQKVRRGLKRLDRNRKLWFGMMVRNGNVTNDSQATDALHSAKTFKAGWIRMALQEYA